MPFAVAVAALPGIAISQEANEAWFPGTSSIAEEEVVPRAYRGRWAPSARACADKVGGDRLDILANGLDSYESGGRLTRVTQSGQERTILLRLAFEGEGRFWDATFLWALNEKGDRLTITEATDDGTPKDGARGSAYVRCAPY